MTPNYDGSQILASDESGDVISWRESDGPDTASQLPLAGSNYPVTWN